MVTCYWTEGIIHNKIKVCSYITILITNRRNSLYSLNMYLVNSTKYETMKGKHYKQTRHRKKQTNIGALDKNFFLWSTKLFIGTWLSCFQVPWHTVCTDTHVHASIEQYNILCENNQPSASDLIILSHTWIHTTRIQS